MLITLSQTGKLFCFLNEIAHIKNHILLSAYYLPKDVERYQFCYVDEDGLVRGTSVPFQFCPDPDEDIMVVINKVCKPSPC
jgi:hypothetical protein